MAVIQFDTLVRNKAIKEEQANVERIKAFERKMWLGRARINNAIGESVRELFDMGIPALEANDQIYHHVEALVDSYNNVFRKMMLKNIEKGEQKQENRPAPSQ
jgi:hypothetical protein